MAKQTSQTCEARGLDMTFHLKTIRTPSTSTAVRTIRLGIVKTRVGRPGLGQANEPSTRSSPASFSRELASVAAVVASRMRMTDDISAVWMSATRLHEQQQLP